LLALVLAIGLVVDDAIIIVENIYRHIESGQSPVEASIKGARELAIPIISISVVLIAVYVPIGFMGGLTGALFTEFAFTLAGAVGVSAIIALTLSPMMCSLSLKPSVKDQHRGFVGFIDEKFDKLRGYYEHLLQGSLKNVQVTIVFALIILSSIYFLYATSKNELAPQEDQGLIISLLTAAPNATLQQTQLYSNQVFKIFQSYPETDHVFQLDGVNGLNTSIGGMVFKPWNERKRTTNQLQPQIQHLFDGIAGARVAAFQKPSLPGGGSGLPVQFVITTTDDYVKLNDISQALLDEARKSGLFVYLDSDLKLDKPQSAIQLDRDKAAQLGLTMADVGDLLASAMSENYINYFNFDGRSYQVIPQVMRGSRLNADQLLNYYLKISKSAVIPLSTIARLKTIVVPESINHFQQLNSATISAVPFPGVTMGDALQGLQKIAKKIFPENYNMDYAAQSRQYQQESSALILTFFLALIIIFLCLAAQFESFRDPLIILISVPMSICGALIFISLGIGGASLNIYTEVGLVTLIGLISKHGILIVQFANDLQQEGHKKQEAIQMAAGIRLRPILMTTASMVLGVIPLILASGAGATSRFNIGLVIASGISIGTLFTLFVVPAMYLLLAQDHQVHTASDLPGDTVLNG
jgi:multidrug efflux pump